MMWRREGLVPALAIAPDQVRFQLFSAEGPNSLDETSLNPNDAEKGSVNSCSGYSTGPGRV